MVYHSKNEDYEEIIETATFLPKTLNISGEIKPNKLYRNIYDVVVYETDLTLNGSFDAPDFTALNIPLENVLWEKAQLNIVISDLRGINEAIKVEWNKNNFTFSPGISNSSLKGNGISLVLPNFEKSVPAKYHCTLKLKGSQHLMFSPLGEITKVNLQSTWNDPSFTGDFLPQNRDISESGFKASWQILHFNRNFPQAWVGNNYQIDKSDFGVELITMADHYQKNTRSAKYAVLVIILTFTVFFFNEVFTKKRVHPFQYIMVGSAITIFYLLLLSFSEHLGFDLAYLIASLSVLVLVFIYSRSFLPSFKAVTGSTLTLLACYAFIFILLQLESFALVAGSIGLFAVLAILMFLTRNINWYKE